MLKVRVEKRWKKGDEKKRKGGKSQDEDKDRVFWTFLHLFTVTVNIS